MVVLNISIPSPSVARDYELDENVGNIVKLFKHHRLPVKRLRQRISSYFYSFSVRRLVRLVVGSHITFGFYFKIKGKRRKTRRYLGEEAGEAAAGSQVALDSLFLACVLKLVRIAWYAQQ